MQVRVLSGTFIGPCSSMVEHFREKDAGSSPVVRPCHEQHRDNACRFK